MFSMAALHKYVDGEEVEVPLDDNWDYDV